MEKRILLVGGGTGGHVFPLQAVAEALRLQVQPGTIDLKLAYLGDGDFLAGAAKESDTPYYIAMAPKWRRGALISNLLDIIKLPIGFLQSLFYVWKFMPDMIFAKGGYASVLPIVAGRLLAIPVVIHDSDAIPGKSNIFLSRFSRKVFLAFEVARSYFSPKLAIEVVGVPIRQSLVAGMDRLMALATFQFQAEKPTVFITGSSQGAKAINDIVMLAIVELTKEFQVIHQCGKSNYKDLNDTLQKIITEEQGVFGDQIKANYRLYDFLDAKQFQTTCLASDVIVSRASSSIFEFALFAKPTIVIPLPGSASGHQSANAVEFAKYGAQIIDQANLSPHILINDIKQAYEHRAEISPKIAQFAKPDAAMVIARELIQAIGQ